jgi:hypothetical protein
LDGAVPLCQDCARLGGLAESGAARELRVESGGVAIEMLGRYLATPPDEPPPKI